MSSGSDAVRWKRTSICVRRRALPPLFAAAAADYLARRKPSWAPKTYIIETTNLEHLKPHFGRLLVTDITDRDVAEYQQARQDAGAAPKTINNNSAQCERFSVASDCGRRSPLMSECFRSALTLGSPLAPDQEERLLKACAASRSRSLLPAVTLDIQTGLRSEEVRFLRWRQVDLLAKAVTVGKSKTPSGDGRVVPLNRTAAKALSTWAQQFPARKPEHYVFPSERVGFSGNGDMSQGLWNGPDDAHHVVEGGLDYGAENRRGPVPIP